MNKLEKFNAWYSVLTEAIKVQTEIQKSQVNYPELDKLMEITIAKMREISYRVKVKEEVLNKSQED